MEVAKSPSCCCSVFCIKTTPLMSCCQPMTSWCKNAHRNPLLEDTGLLLKAQQLLEDSVMILPNVHLRTQQSMTILPHFLFHSPSPRVRLTSDMKTFPDLLLLYPLTLHRLSANKMLYLISSQRTWKTQEATSNYRCCLCSESSRQYVPCNWKIPSTEFSSFLQKLEWTVAHDLISSEKLWQKDKAFLAERGECYCTEIYYNAKMSEWKGWEHVFLDQMCTTLQRAGMGSSWVLQSRPAKRNNILSQRR